MTQLDKDFQALTGLRYTISQIVESASTPEEKQKAYDFISWNIKQGRIMEKATNKALAEAIMNEIKSLDQKSTIDDVVEQETYTAEEAAAYNLTLEGALVYGAVKTPAVEAVEAQPAIYSFASFGVDDDAAYGTGTVKAISQDLQENATTIEVLTNEPAGNTTPEEAAQFVGKQYIVHATELEVNKHYNLYSDSGLQTPIYVTVELVSEAVEAVEAQEEVLYTNEEVDAHNAQLPGAKHEGDAKE